MRRLVLVLGMIVFGLVDAGPIAGQEVGQPITLAGCLVQEDDDGDEVEFLLDNVTGAAAAAEEIELVPAEGVELAAHVGHMVEVSGVVIANEDDDADEDDADEDDEDDHDDDDEDDDEDDENELHIRVTRLGHQAASCGNAR